MEQKEKPVNNSKFSFLGKALFVVGIILALFNTHKIAYSIGYFLGEESDGSIPRLVKYSSGAREPTELKMINMINEERTRVYLKPLNENAQLDLSARNKACDMLNKNYFTHDSPSGKTPWDFIEEVGYNYHFAGENQSNGVTDLDEMMQKFMQSPEHRKNIMSPDYKEIGIGICGSYLVQHFGDR